MASGRPHQPSAVSRSSSSIAPSACHSEVTGKEQALHGEVVELLVVTGQEEVVGLVLVVRLLAGAVGLRVLRVLGVARIVVAHVGGQVSRRRSGPGPPSASAVITASQSKWSMAQIAAISLSVSSWSVSSWSGLSWSGPCLSASRPAPGGRHARGHAQPQLGVIGGQFLRAQAAALGQQPPGPARPGRGPGAAGSRPGAGPPAAAGGRLRRSSRAWVAASASASAASTRPGTPRLLVEQDVHRDPAVGQRRGRSTAPAPRCRPGWPPDRPPPAGRGRSRPRRPAPPGGLTSRVCISAASWLRSVCSSQTCRPMIPSARSRWLPARSGRRRRWPCRRRSRPGRTPPRTRPRGQRVARRQHPAAQARQRTERVRRRHGEQGAARRPAGSAC